MALMRPDPTFYPSPRMAMQAPAERLAYVTLLNVGGNGKRDAMGVIDLDPRSSGYGKLVGQVDFPHGDNELHHFGWNACSACLCPQAPHAHMERRYLIVPGHRLVADSHPGYEAESQAAEAREGDRAGRVHQQDRLHRAAHDSLRPRRHLRERARWTDRRRPRRPLPDGSRNLRAEGPVGKGPRPAAAGVRLLVAPGPRHHHHLRVGHAEHGEGRRQPGVAAGRQVRPQAPRLGSGYAPPRAGARSGRGAADGARAAAVPRSEQGLRVRRRGGVAQGPVVVDLDVVSRRRRDGQERQVGGPQGH